MAQYNRANTATNLNLTGAWVEGVVPTSVDIAAWGTPNISTGTAQALGGAVSWQGILLQSAQSTAITIGTTAAALTLGSSGIDLSAASANLTIASPVTITLGANQSWSVAAGRTLTVSSVITGAAKNVTLNGSGIKTLSGASTGWTGSTVTVAGGQATVSNINGLGAASNSVVVNSGANLTVSAAIAPTAITINGAGFTGGTGYGALWTTNVLASGQTITFGATGTVLSTAVGSATFAPQLAVSPGVTSITLNIPNAFTNTTFSFSSSYTVADGVRLQSYGSNGTTASNGRYSFGAATTTTDSNSGVGAAGGGLGAASNKVIVEQTGCLYFAGAVNFSTATLARNYEFVGITAPSTTQYQGAVSVTSIMDFTGTVSLTGTAGQVVWFAGPNLLGNLRAMVKFSGTLTGATNLWVGDKGAANAAGAVGIGASLVSSGFTGTLNSNTFNYYAGTSGHTFPVVFRGNAPNSNQFWINATAGTSSANHSSYTREVAGVTIFNVTSIGQTGNLTLGGGSYVSAPGEWSVQAGTLTLDFAFSGTAGAFTKSGTSTLVLGGNNTAFTNVTLSQGTLVLNGAGSAGPSAASFTFGNGVRLNSTVGATLNQNGAVNPLTAGGTWTWVGTNDLTFGTGNLTAGGDQVIAFDAGGGLGTVKFRGNITTSLATTSWNFGGSTAGAKQRVTLGGANASLAAGTTADQHSVTAGYFRIENNNGLGAAGTTTIWWVGATNAGVQTTKAALELAGVTTPDTKNIRLYNIGPNDDGALIGVSGTSVFSGSIAVPNVAGTRIGVKAGATLTLLGSGSYPNLNPDNSNTPLSFTAEVGGTLNQNRVLGSNVGTVTVTGGSGTVVLSRANLHTGATTCSAGTTKVTHVNATSTGSVFVPAGATLESTVQSQFQSTLSLGTTSSLSRAILKFAA
jgi:autotransporter-associated beta strand protein